MAGLFRRAARELASPAMIVALLALTLSLGGTAYAAKLITSKQIKNGTVTSADLKNNGVRSKDIRNNGVTSADIKDGGVTSTDIADGGVTSTDIADGGVTSSDVQDGTIALDDLSPAVKAAISDTWDPSRTLVSGRTITGSAYYRIASPGAGQGVHQSISFPARAPAEIEANFAADGSPVTTDDDTTCGGSYNAPTAPPGKVCAYYEASDNLTLLSITPLVPGKTRGFTVLASATAAGAVSIDFSWAYTAP